MSRKRNRNKSNDLGVRVKHYHGSPMVVQEETLETRINRAIVRGLGQGLFIAALIYFLRAIGVINV